MAENRSSNNDDEDDDESNRSNYRERLDHSLTKQTLIGHRSGRRRRERTKVSDRRKACQIENRLSSFAEIQVGWRGLLLRGRWHDVGTNSSNDNGVVAASDHSAGLGALRRETGGVGEVNWISLGIMTNGDRQRQGDGGCRATRTEFVGNMVSTWCRSREAGRVWRHIQRR